MRDILQKRYQPGIFIFNINCQAHSARMSPIPKIVWPGSIYGIRLPELQGIEGVEIYMELSSVN